jgi:uncharacterized protein YndB with AHSA1/START domain
MSSKNVIVEGTYNADISSVWNAITVKELMKQWYFDLKEFRAEIGFKFEFMGGPENGIQYKHLCEITEVIPEQKLSYSWKYEGYEGISFVTFELFKENNTSKVKLTHTGIKSFPSSNPDFDIHNFEEGWKQIIKTSLQLFLDKNRNR